jgi:hypothetical protein
MVIPPRSRLAVTLALAAGLAACGHNPQPAAPAPQPTPPPRAVAPRPAPTPTAAAPAAAPATASQAPAAQAPAAAPAAPAPMATPAFAPVAAAAPAPVAAASRADLAGDWEWTAMMEGQPYFGTMSFQAAGSGYTGILRVSGLWDATVRTVTVTGTTVRVVFDGPEGELVMDAQFTDPNNLSGRVDVASAGAIATIAARRR